MSENSKINGVNESEYLTNEDDDLTEEIERLKANLTETYITKFFKKNYKLKMKASNNKYSNLSDEEYFKDHEQIDEVKYNFFMIMHNRCKSYEEYSSVINEYNEFAIRRLTIQECLIRENMIFPGEKNYSFISLHSGVGKKKEKDLFYEFPLDNKIISINTKDNKINKLMINNQEVKITQEEPFILENNLNLPKIEKEIKEQAGKAKSTKGTKLTKKKYSSKNSPNIFPLNSSEESSSKRSDASLKELLGETVYFKTNGNSYTRYIFLDKYNKEIDGIYTKHNDINLNSKTFIDIDNLSVKNLNYNNNNDLKAHLIYKSFESDKIEKDTPFILEIKQNFRLCELMDQIKQDCKILGNLHFSTDNIKLPNYIIGVLCNFSEIGIEKEINTLIHKDIITKQSKLDHIKDIIKKYNMNVVICMIKDGKIGNYLLDKEDYKNESEELKYRVDLSYMHRQIYGKEIEKELLDDIIKENKEKYRSITAEKTYSFDYVQNLKEQLKTAMQTIASLQKTGDKKDNNDNGNNNQGK